MDVEEDCTIILNYTLDWGVLLWFIGLNWFI